MHYRSLLEFSPQYGKSKDEIRLSGAIPVIIPIDAESDKRLRGEVPATTLTASDVFRAHQSAPEKSSSAPAGCGGRKRALDDDGKETEETVSKKAREETVDVNKLMAKLKLLEKDLLEKPDESPPPELSRIVEHLTATTSEPVECVARPLSCGPVSPSDLPETDDFSIPSRSSSPDHSRMVEPPTKRTRFASAATSSRRPRSPPLPVADWQRQLAGSSGAQQQQRERGYQNLSVLQRFTNSILRWNPARFAESSLKWTAKEIYPSLPLHWVAPNCYSSYSDYVEMWLPFLVAECYEQVFADWESAERVNMNLSCVLTAHRNAETVAKGFLDVTVETVVAKNCEAPTENSLVHLVLLKRQRHFFGIVKSSKAMQADVASIPIHLRDLCTSIKSSHEYKEKNIVTMIVRTCCFNFESPDVAFERESVYLKKTSNLTTFVRQAQALVVLEGATAISKLILQPQVEAERFDLKRSEASKRQLMCEVPEGVATLNGPQRNIVQSCVVQIFDDDAAGIWLIHGPPGTGKSRTIVDICDEFVRTKRRMAKIAGTILVLAPSNAAVDELTRGFRDRNQACRGNSQKQHIKFVRIGQEESIANDVSAYFIDRVVERNLLKADQELKAKAPNQRLLQSQVDELKLVEEELRRVKEQMQKSEGRAGSTEVREQGRRKQQLLERRRKLQPLSATCLAASQKRSSPEYAAQFAEKRREVVVCADVILSTLSSIGSSWLDAVLSSKQARIRAAFVDEACQANEIETLIPLKWDVKKVFLVGDPKQLPPTVMNQECRNGKFDRSLFERLLETLHIFGSVAPISLLSVQYRMDPEISQWVNERYYEGRLQNAGAFTKKFLLRPYALFDLAFGVERRSKQGEKMLIEDYSWDFSSSYLNHCEAKFVCRLVQKLLQLKAYEDEGIKETDIGVITPYREQVQAIKFELKTPHRKIEVNTVDGFQGRQKPIIILSCVRGPTEDGQVSSSIGFLRDSRRLNVSLSRAQRALYIVGHLSQLEACSDDWRALIGDARNRGVVVSMVQDSQLCVSTAFDFIKQA